MVEKIRDELNYKQAYLFLFNKLIDITTEIAEIQQKAEEIAISSLED